MGFPVGGCCPDMALPPFLVYLVLFLAHLRSALAWALGALGLGDLLDADDFLGDPTGLRATSHAFPLEAAAGAGAGAGTTTTTRIPLASYTHPRPSRSLCASLIREALPSSPYEPPHPQDCSDPESCAVCLHELESGDQVRRLGGCRHVFHASCIDPWVDLGRRTCPLCRAPLVPQKLRDSHLTSGTDLWQDAAPVTDSSYAVPFGTSYLGELYLADDGDYYPTPPDNGDYFFDDDDISLGLPPLEHSRHAEFLSWPTLQDNAHAAPTPVFFSSSSSS